MARACSDARESSWRSCTASAWCMFVAIQATGNIETHDVVDETTGQGNHFVRDHVAHFEEQEKKLGVDASFESVH